MTYAGIFFLSLSTLLFEVSLLRVFSVALWYHFAFMVVSIAFLGYASGGVVLMLVKRLQKTPLHVFPLLFAFFSPLSYIVANKIPFDPARFAWDTSQIFFVVFYYLSLSVPFVFSGMTMAMAFLMMGENAGKIYASDLLGAGTGPLLAIALFPHLGVEGVILASSIAGFFSSIFFLKEARGIKGLKKLTPPLLGIAMALGLLFFRPSFIEIKISRYKALPFALSHKGGRIVQTRSNSFSRVDLVESPAVRFAPGLSLKYPGPLPDELGITEDGDFLRAVVNPEEKEKLKFLDYLPTALPYKLLEGKKPEVFIVDAGGGLSILESIYHGAASVSGSEKNPLVAELSNTPFSGFIYKRADIKTGEARTVLKNAKKNYDIINIGIGAQNPSMGLYGFSEDYRFTVDAFKEYLLRLREGGLLSITTYLLPPPREELKLAATVIRALEESGIKEPEKNLFVFRTLETFTIIVKNGSLNAFEIALAKDFLKSMRFDAVYHPGITPAGTNVFNRFQEDPYFKPVGSLLNKDTREKFIQGYIFSITPPTDEKPFFHHFFKPGRIHDVIKSTGGKWQILLEGGYLLPLVFFQALIASSVLLILPLLKKEKGAEGPAPAKAGAAASPFLAYFFLIGTGFMFVEISLIQRFILFIGRPEYAFSMVVATLLVSSGAGSFFSQRVSPEKAISWLPVLVSALVAFLSLALPFVISRFLGSGFIHRLMLTFFIIMPAGFFMGMPFPLGMRFLGKRGKTFIPWAWAVNGCASVTGSVGGAMLAMAVGFRGVLLCGAAAYLLSAVFMIFAKKKARL
ncbi:MAG TPA: hypothetical protein VI914_08045 [Thermodesulfobacteriota bacterium]|nr:hypothetical protein [Thermodesulfobacteriota bacterium]